MNGPGSGKTIAVAMSGGVDSSVAAGLLVRGGYKVSGITLVFRPESDTDSTNRYCGQGAVENASAVCRTLGIDHHIINCAADFEKIVLRPAWETYKAGRTPSPCIICNARIKFRTVMETAKSIGASALATGHYAVIEHGEHPVLRRGTYAAKDQTYFLYALNREQLDFTRFPLGRLKKEEVRVLAREMDLVNAERKDSQDACFVTAEGSFQEALRIRFNESAIPGSIIDPEGNILGEHNGIHNYTIGQRRGLKIAMGERAFVSRIDAGKNEVVLTTNESDLYSSTVIAGDVAWTGGVKPDFPLRCEGQVRYRSKPYPGTADLDSDGKLRMVFEEAQRAVTPGQALVLYNGDRVLGGGWIEACEGQ
ncbi:MAG: tRNA 2-thiouridine(34) synthase MnmA [Spirochaetales bacterium]|nr:tRNA 2-thiouridine(34) synthase MnmA [Spirochaetales bacterium]